MHQVAALAVGNAEDGWVGQAIVRPGAMRGEHATQARALGEVWQHGWVVAHAPTVARTGADTRERNQQAERDQFARLQRGVRMLGHGVHTLIHPTQQTNANSNGRHTAFLGADVSTPPA